MAETGPCPCPNPPPTWNDVVAHQMASLMAVGNMSLQQATENSGRLSAMFGVRSAQTNPIEAASIQTLKAAGSGENAQSNATAVALMGLANAFSAMAQNTAHATPTKPA